MELISMVILMKIILKHLVIILLLQKTVIYGLKLHEIIILLVQFSQLKRCVPMVLRES